MRHARIAAGAALLTIVCANVAAQDEREGPRFTPVEIYTCNYNEGKGSADLDKATDEWNKFMDKNEVGTYFAVTMTPEYFGPDTFDFAWLGAWSSGEAMGGGTDLWHAKGGEFAAKFAAVADCDSHSNFATTMIKAPPGEGEPASMVLTFTDCTVNDGVDFPQVLEGSHAWAKYQEELGYGNGTWMMFPAFGGGDAEYDFKLANSFENYAGVGKMYDLYGNGGGYQKHGELVGELFECNVDRVYNAKVRRNMSDE